MRKSKVLDKVRAGQCARICGLGHYLPFFVRYAAHNGYDGIWLDLEHRAMDQREVQGLLALCRACDIDCMLRAPTLERTRLYRYLEDGATGLMMPLVSDADLARQIVAAVKYPPLGNRGLDGAGLDGISVSTCGMRAVPISTTPIARLLSSCRSKPRKRWPMSRRSPRSRGWTCSSSARRIWGCGSVWAGGCRSRSGRCQSRGGGERTRQSLGDTRRHARVAGQIPRTRGADAGLWRRFCLGSGFGRLPPGF